MKNINFLLEEFKEEWNSIHEFWANNTVDELNGGFVGEISFNGQINTKADKGVVLNSRILWSLSSAYIHTGKLRYLELATRAFDYLLAHFWDEDFGGLYWSVDAKGVVVSNRKQAYAQGFGIYAFAEYYKASQDEKSKQYAISLFKLLENKFKDKQYGGYIEALGRDWSLLGDMRLSLKDANEPKSMNTHLHIIEPYTNLFSVWNNPDLEHSIRDLLVLFQQKILNTKTMQFQLFFDMDWTVKSSEISFGHDIECTWLLCDAARVIKDAAFEQEMDSLAIKVVDKVLTDGTDKDGSLFYEVVEGKIDKDKHWWVQAEAIIGLVNAFKISGKKDYLDEAIRIFVFIKENIKDRNYGEWFWRVDKNNKPILSDCKVGFWKCPYHNTRALIESYNRLK